MFSRGVSQTAARLSQRIANARPHPQGSPFAQLPLRARIPPIQPCMSTRNASAVAQLRDLRKKHPFMVPLAAALILFGAGTLLYAPYVYQKYIIAQYHKFPEPVAVKLRRAIYYTNIQLDPKEALKYYRQALEVADELGVDPFSDEILGVKIQIAAMFEKIENYQRAIDVLEIVRRDCLRWMDELGDKHWNDGKRTRVLAKTIAISVKLGDLYAGDQVLNKEAAEERLVWAVETALKEKHRREKEGVKEGEGDWVTDEELGGALESLAHNYEAKDQHYLATPLFLQALTLSPPKSCHTIVLMNNLATSLAQQNPPAYASNKASRSAKPSSEDLAPSSPSFPSTLAPPRSVLLAQATQWAQKALEVAPTVPRSELTEECSIGCAVATHNLGEFAEMAGNVKEAGRKYLEAEKLSKKIGFAEGVANARDGLRRLEGRT